MMIRSIEQWQALFKQHDESGLKASEFCRANKLCPRCFSKRKRDLAWSAKDASLLETQWRQSLLPVFSYSRQPSKLGFSSDCGGCPSIG